MSNRIYQYANGHTESRPTGGHEGRSTTEPARTREPASRSSMLSSGKTEVMERVKSLIQKRPAVAIGAAVATGLVLGFWAKRK